MGWEGRYTGTSLFGLDGRDGCHVGGGGSVMDGSFDLVCLDIDDRGYDWFRSYEKRVRGQCSSE